METDLFIDKELIKKFILFHQGLLKPLFFDQEGIIEYINQVGCIQYDPLNIISRNANLVLQARIDYYQESMSDDLLYRERKLIDGWDKMMSIYATTDWPYMSSIREAHKVSSLRTMNYRNTKDALLMTNEMIEYLSVHGACYPNEIQSSSHGDSRWGSNKLSSVALDYLYHTGIIGIKNRKNATRQYDLIENLLNPEILSMTSPFINEHDFIKWYVIRKINGVGVYWNHNGIVWHNAYTKRKEERNPSIKELIDDGTLIAFHITGSKHTFFITKQNYERLNEIETVSYTKQVKFIAPLDNLIWDRDLLRFLFDFDYVWEVYKPSELRKYGYYVLPVLYGDRFIARFEAKLDRKSSMFIIYHWWWEEDIQIDDEMLEQINIALNKFQVFLGAEHMDDDAFKQTLNELK